MPKVKVLVQQFHLLPIKKSSKSIRLCLPDFSVNTVNKYHSPLLSLYICNKFDSGQNNSHIINMSILRNHFKCFKYHSSNKCFFVYKNTTNYYSDINIYTRGKNYSNIQISKLKLGTTLLH